MKLFKVTKKLCVIYGVALNPNQFNWPSSIVLFIFGISFISNFLYSRCEAKTFQEYADSIFIGTTLTTAMMTFAYLAWKIQSIFICIDDAEDSIDDSELTFMHKTSYFAVKIRFKTEKNILELKYHPKSKPIYMRSNRATDRINSILFAAIVIIFFPLAMISILSVSFCDYLTTDLGSEAFQMPFPFWYVFVCATNLIYKIMNFV